MRNLKARVPLTVIACGLLAACSKTSDEERIRTLISGAETAVEARDTSDAMQLVADDYADGQGFDKEQLRGFLRAYFLAHPKIELLVRTTDVEFKARDLARVKVEVAAVGTRAQAAGESLSGDLQALQVEVQLRDGEWRVTRVDRVQ